MVYSTVRSFDTTVTLKDGSQCECSVAVEVVPGESMTRDYPGSPEQIHIMDITDENGGLIDVTDLQDGEVGMLLDYFRQTF